MSRGELERYEAREKLMADLTTYAGTAKRVETKEEPAPAPPTVTFDWGSGGRISGRSHGRRPVPPIYKEVAGALGFCTLVAAFVFGLVALCVWGDPDTYAGLEKKHAKDVTAKLLTKYGHDDWRALEPTESSIFNRDAWSVQVKRPGASPRCIFVWEGDGVRMSRLSRCKAVAS